MPGTPCIVSYAAKQLLKIILLNNTVNLLYRQSHISTAAITSKNAEATVTGAALHRSVVQQKRLMQPISVAISGLQGNCIRVLHVSSGRQPVKMKYCRRGARVQYAWRRGARVRYAWSTPK